MPTEETIPVGFAEAMRQVAELIEAGDETTRIKSDDLLQIGDVVGGLYNPAECGFGFCMCLRRHEDDHEPISDDRGRLNGAIT